MSTLAVNLAKLSKALEGRFTVALCVLRSHDLHLVPSREDAIKEHARICEIAKKGTYDASQERWTNGEYNCTAGYAQVRHDGKVLDYYVDKGVIETGINEWETRAQYQGDTITIVCPEVEAMSFGDNITARIKTYDGEYHAEITGDKIRVTWECGV